MGRLAPRAGKRSVQVVPAQSDLSRVGKNRLKLNLCQPVAFINLSRFKPAFINKSRLKFRINEITENHSSKE